MKPQDIIFFIVILIFFFIRKARVAAYAGIFCLLVSILLFAKWIFFTAERLTWYAAAFFLLAILVNLYQLRDNKNDENRHRHKSNRI